jgi:hypothetical protein
MDTGRCRVNAEESQAPRLDIAFDSGILSETLLQWTLLTHSRGCN